jgi:O-antigen/teichoic acid export membrane protein
MVRLLSGNQGRNLVLTFLTEFILLLVGFLTLQLAGRVLGSVGFGEYAVSKRAMSVIAYPLLLGLGISIPRYLALAETSESSVNDQQRAYFFAGVGLAIPIVTGFAVVVLQLPAFFAQMFFGGSEFARLVPSVVLLTIGMCLHILQYGYFRGRMQMWRANLFQFFNMGLVPPVMILLVRQDTAKILAFTGSVWIGVSTLVLIALVLKMRFWKFPVSLWQDSVHELFRYGLPRVPGEFALFGLFAIPTFLIANYQGIEVAGFFSFGVSILQMIAGLFRAVGIVLLPYVSRLTSEAQWGKVKSVVAKTLSVCLVLALAIAVLLELMVGVVVPLFMGPSFSRAIPYVSWLLLGSVPYVLYTVLRNPLDAVTEWPYNSINLIITIVVLIVLLLLRSPLLSPGVAMTIALCLLGLLTLWSWRRSLEQVIRRGKAQGSIELLDQTSQV